MSRKIFDDEFEQALVDHLWDKVAPRAIAFVQITNIVNELPETIKITEASKLTGIPVSYFKSLYHNHGKGIKMGTADNSPIHIKKHDLIEVLGHYNRLSDEQVRKAIARLAEKVSKAKSKGKTE